jgi:hypothetical protein
MSLRGSETTEAISQGIENREIATLPSVARNDRKGIATQSPRGEGEGGGDVNLLITFVLVIGAYGVTECFSRQAASR